MMTDEKLRRTAALAHAYDIAALAMATYRDDFNTKQFINRALEGKRDEQKLPLPELSPWEFAATLFEEVLAKRGYRIVSAGDS